MDVREPQVDIPAGGAFLVGPQSAKEWQNLDSQGNRLVKAVRTCVAQIEDGYCDAVCGNCSYVLPKLSIGEAVTALEGQEVQFFAYEGPNKKEVSYVRTDPSRPRPSVPQIEGNLFPDTEGVLGYKDEFTYCLPADGRQALSVDVLTQAGGFFRFMTGIYGHNSNSDAKAELRAFTQCAKNPRYRELVPVNACGACGIVRPGVHQQWPCLDEKNFA